MDGRENSNAERNEREHIAEIERHKDTILRLEACLCALISELSKSGPVGELLKRASKNGGIDLVSFWQRHKQADYARVEEMYLKTFSEHERSILKEILK